jgi:hypothetical protein
MENSSTSNIIVVRKAILKMISKKLLTLNNMLHVIDIKRNLINGSLLSKKWL